MESSRFLVGGGWRTSAVERAVVNPFTSETVGSVFQATPQHIDLAIRAASDAFQETRKLQAYQRADILAFVAREVHSGREELAQLITSETGKPISFSRAEVDRSVFTFTIASEEAKRIEGSVLPLDLAAHSGSRFGLVRRFPIGPIAAITPFNFPINLVAHKVAPAIAAGNTVVLKPSSSAPLAALWLGRIVERSGLPKGSFNIVPCLAGEAEQLITDQRIKLLSFTGSPSIGWRIKEKAGKKKVVLELGGNAGVIVDRDANIEFALKRIVQGSFGNAGQSCIAVQRIYVHKEVYDEFQEKFVTLARSVAVGDPTKEETVVGPMITEEAASEVAVWIEEAVAGGAQLLCGGKRKGAVLDPSILIHVKSDMKVSCNEVFAPVVTLDMFSDFPSAVAQVNDSKYGLQAGVFSNNLSNVWYAYQHLDVGGVIVNDFPTYRVDHMPYGGVKDSGFGREGVRYSIDEMTEMKLLAFNLL